MTLRRITLGITYALLSCLPVLSSNQLPTTADNSHDFADASQRNRADAMHVHYYGGLNPRFGGTYGQRGIYDRLVRPSIPVIPRTNIGDPPLHYAAKIGKQEICAFLLDNDADVNAQDDYGNTPLHKAAEGGSETTFTFLLEQGANIHAQNKEGNTPLHTAVLHGNQAICLLFLRYNVDVTLLNKKGQTALDVTEHREIKQRFATHEATKITGYLRTIAHDTPQVITFLVFSFTLGSQWYTYVQR